MLYLGIVIDNLILKLLFVVNQKITKILHLYRVKKDETTHVNV